MLYQLAFFLLNHSCCFFLPLNSSYICIRFNRVLLVHFSSLCFLLLPPVYNVFRAEEGILLRKKKAIEVYFQILSGKPEYQLICILGFIIWEVFLLPWTIQERHLWVAHWWDSDMNHLRVSFLLCWMPGSLAPWKCNGVWSHINVCGMPHAL